MIQNMRFEDISPFVRAAIIRTLDGDKTAQTTVAYDHRIFYVLSGHCTVEVAETCFTAGPGAAMLWMSGIPYTLIPDEKGLQMIVVNFDFTQKHAEDVIALPPVTPQNFEPEKLLEKISFTDAPMLNAPLVIDNLPAILPYLQNMLQEAAIPTLWSNFQLNTLLRMTLTAMCRNNISSAGNNKRSADIFQKVLNYIHDHYTEPLTNGSLAEQFNYHPNYISQLFVQRTGSSLHQYLLGIRVRHALYLLQTTDLTIKEIATQSGFGNVSYFCQYIKNTTGYPPTSFRL